MVTKETQPFDESLIGKLHQEILQSQQSRLKIDLLKVTFVTALLGFGTFKSEDLKTLQYSLYLAPAVAIFFEMMSMGHTFAIRRCGKFLRLHSLSPLEKKYESWAATSRDPFFPSASIAFDVVSLLATVFLVRAVTGMWPTDGGKVILAALAIFQLIVWLVYIWRIAKFDRI